VRHDRGRLTYPGDDHVDQLVTMVPRTEIKKNAVGYALPECTLLGKSPRKLAQLLSLGPDIDHGVFVMAYRPEAGGRVLAELEPDQPYRRLRHLLDRVPDRVGPALVYSFGWGVVAAAAESGLEIELHGREATALAVQHGATRLIASYRGLDRIRVSPGDAAWCGKVLAETTVTAIRFELRTCEGGVLLDPADLLGEFKLAAGNCGY